jgi:hypothetical protein
MMDSALSATSWERLFGPGASSKMFGQSHKKMFA